jgi:hypothetical protein
MIDTTIRSSSRFDCQDHAYPMLILLLMIYAAGADALKHGGIYLVSSSSLPDEPLIALSPKRQSICLQILKTLGISCILCSMIHETCHISTLLGYIAWIT